MSKEYLIRLPWPDSAMNANKRLHWRVVADAKAKQRKAAWALAKEQCVTSLPNAVLEFSYSPPDGRNRDCQNIPHMLKSAIDGIADAMGVDDHKFQCIFPSEFSPIVKGGCVLVHIKPGAI